MVSSDLGKAGGQTPADVGLGMHDGRRSTGSQHTGKACALDEGTTFHLLLLSDPKWWKNRVNESSRGAEF
jgi:hypothetical protein